jgi:hypothetical protein
MRSKLNDMRFHLRLGALSAAALLSACSGSAVQQSIEPAISTPVNPTTQTTLKLAVGTANIAGVHGLNTLESFRQSSGASAGASILLNAPTLTGPAGFVVPATADAGADKGTNHISGTIQTSLTSPPPATTFDPTSASNPSVPAPSIASAYGFLPSASTNSQQVPNLIPAPMPYYAAANAALTQFEYVGGPPAFTPPGHTSTQDGTFTLNNSPGSYPGYTLGFNDFVAAPVAGTYALNVVVPTGLSTSGVESYGNVKTTAPLALTFLPTWATAPTFTSDGAGGGTITLGYGAGGGVTEEYVELVNTGVTVSGSNAGNTCDHSGAGPYYYTFKVTPGQATVAVPDNIGPATPGSAQPHTLCTAAENTAANGVATLGDGYSVYGFAVDYPLLESAFPKSTGVVSPTIAGSNGQADIATSAATTGNSL